MEEALVSGGVWAVALAGAGGVIAGLNPCCLALYPAVGATCCVTAEGTAGRVAVSRALALVVGAALGTTVLGVLAALAGHAVTTLSRSGRYALAFVPILAGLQFMGVLRMPLPLPLAWQGGGLLAAFGTGLFLSLVVTACATPVLAAVLSYAAYQGSAVFGALLLFSYGLGNGLPLLVFGTGVGAAAASLGATVQRWLNGVAAVTLLVLGFYLLFVA